MGRDAVREAQPVGRLEVEARLEAWSNPAVLFRPFWGGIRRIGEGMVVRIEPPVTVSLDEDIETLLHDCPACRPLVAAYRHHGEKKLKDLPLTAAERDQLLVKLFLLKKELKPRRG
jgi:hypothetical protein